MMNKRLIWQTISITMLAFMLLSACAGLPTGQPAQNNFAAPTSAAPTVNNNPTTTSQSAIPVTSTDGPAVSTGAATSAATQAQAGQPAASCASPAALTPAMTEGPYFKAGSPANANLADGQSGMKLTLTGYVFTADCQPVANALLDFWQANSQGQYDNAGYTLRGHITTDASGRYQIETIVPGLYPGRTEHIHVKVQAPNGPVLTTQLFFPGVPQNQEDGIFDQRLLLNIQQQNGSMNATYNFVVAAK